MTELNPNIILAAGQNNKPTFDPVGAINNGLTLALTASKIKEANSDAATKQAALETATGYRNALANAITPQDREAAAAKYAQMDDLKSLHTMHQADEDHRQKAVGAGRDFISRTVGVIAQMPPEQRGPAWQQFKAHLVGDLSNSGLSEAEIADAAQRIPDSYDDASAHIIAAQSDTGAKYVAQTQSEALQGKRLDHQIANENRTFDQSERRMQRDDDRYNNELVTVSTPEGEYQVPRKHLQQTQGQPPALSQVAPSGETGATNVTWGQKQPAQTTQPSMQGAVGFKPREQVLTPQQKIDFEIEKTQSVESAKKTADQKATAQTNIKQSQNLASLASEAQRILTNDDPTHSGLGQVVDQGAAFFGKATSGGVAASRLDTIAKNMVMNVPRFEGPQSNTDVAAYSKAAGDLGNATLPKEVRIEAAKEVIRLQNKSAQQSRDFLETGTWDRGADAQPNPDGYNTKEDLENAVRNKKLDDQQAWAIANQRGIKMGK